MTIYMLPVDGAVGGKVRPLNFYPILGLDPVLTRILNFGRCNFRCPYCFRGAQIQSLSGITEGAEPYTYQGLVTISNEAMNADQMVKLSGGDPCAYSEVSLALARHVKEMGGRVGMAHNGSDPQFASEMGPYLEMAAIDIKATPTEYPLRTGLNGGSRRFYDSSIETIRLLSKFGVILDIRTPVFGDTTQRELEYIVRDLESLHLPPDRTFLTWRLYELVKGCDFKPPNEDIAREMLQGISRGHPSIKMGIRVKTVDARTSNIERLPF